jgi:hypothetical protein
MILNNKPQNEAILSNVNEIGEFRIRNSAKAFSILSSSLYANKIRAIVRELSCNAVDSHKAAGKEATPFDVHLPNQLEPWFSIRDYGVGLSHKQVTEIYTTYFESTKTGSNDFIGALGLGSKTPFAYTDNFTVTAVKDGIRGVYSAFINEQGVPSIALMMSEESTDPNGVEVKFSVNGYSDFDRFITEARNVYSHFSLRPVVSGGLRTFSFLDVKYKEKDIVPGVHYISSENRYDNNSYAVMGNIAYPIAIPDADKELGTLSELLKCGLEIHFGIGELDFQASREGLSYIPITVKNIKTKLQQLNAQLAVHIAEAADKIPNLWERLYYLQKMDNERLFKAAVGKYVADTKFPLIPKVNAHMNTLKFTLMVSELEKKYNIKMSGFNKNRHTVSLKQIKETSVSTGKKQTNGTPEYKPAFEIHPQSHIRFVLGDTNGCISRTKHHFSTSMKNSGTDDQVSVFVISAVDKKKPVKFAALMKDLLSPPKKQILKTSDMAEKPRAGSKVSGKNVTIMKAARRNENGGYYNRRNAYDMVWRDAGTADKLDAKQQYYYIEMSGFKMLSAKMNSMGLDNFVEAVGNSGIKSLQNLKLYGVRKTDIEYIKAQKNWVNAETFVTQVLENLSDEILMGLAAKTLDNYASFKYTEKVASNIIDPASPYLVFANKIKDVTAVQYHDNYFERLVAHWAPNMKNTPKSMAAKLESECKALNRVYPLMSQMNNWRGRMDKEIAQYINLIDAAKSVDEETRI